MIYLDLIICILIVNVAFFGAPPAPRACLPVRALPSGPPGVPTGRRKWPFAKFANFEIRRFSANGFRYSKVFKSELETKEYCDFLVLCISLKLFFHGFYHESQNLQISQFANFSRMVWDIQKISKGNCRRQKNIVTV